MSSIMHVRIYYARALTLHVRFESWYNWKPFSAEQQREMTKFCVFWTTPATTANFCFVFFYLVLNTLFEYSVGASS